MCYSWNKLWFARLVSQYKCSNAVDEILFTRKRRHPVQNKEALLQNLASWHGVWSIIWDKWSVARADLCCCVCMPVFSHFMGTAKDLFSHTLSNRWLVQWSMMRAHAVPERERWEEEDMTVSLKYKALEHKGKASWRCRKDGAKLALDFCLHRNLQLELCTCESVFQRKKGAGRTVGCLS